jgi:hypothetical protein
MPPLDRRSFLRAAGVTLALPWLERMAPAQPPAAAGLPRRLVCVCAPLGFHAPNLFPTAAGRNYQLTPYLDVLRDFRDDFTVISGLAHPNVGSSHDSIFSYLTAAPHPENRAGFRNTISLDQFAANRLGSLTRFPSLTLSCEGFSLSWTASGAIVPSDCFPASVFSRLFLRGRPEDVRAQARQLEDGRSILDTVQGQAAALRQGLGAADRDRLDEYFNSVRELEQRLANQEQWLQRPLPTVNVPPPQNNSNPADLVGKANLMFDLIHLALQTDSTRIVTLLLLGTSLVPPIQGVTQGHHDLSHHGQDTNKIAQLAAVERATMQSFRSFLAKLKDTREQGDTLLDRTTVLFGSNLGNASNHSTRNLPVVLAGGGFRHGQHLAFNPDNPPPLSNLLLSMLRRLGVEAERFGSSTGTLTGLEMGA